MGMMKLTTSIFPLSWATSRTYSRAWSERSSSDQITSEVTKVSRNPDTVIVQPGGKDMDLGRTKKSKALEDRLWLFMEEIVFPSEDELRKGGVYDEILEALKGEAKSRGLWNLFWPSEERGAGLTNLEYAQLAELTGRSPFLAPTALNCAAPDTGNMEILAAFGTDEQKERWLKPLLDGKIRSCFTMTEPAVASSDASNIGTMIERDADEYVITGRKWWSTGALGSDCKVAILMGVTDPSAPRHERHTMVLVPMDSRGLKVLRGLTVFGYDEADQGGHAEISFEDVRVPVANCLGEEGSGFAIAQARLGPGRIHHCMRAVGMAERALGLMCQRVTTRNAFGKNLAEQGVIQNWIADARIEIEQTRLLILKTAWLIDTVGAKSARAEISAIKVAAPTVATRVIDRAIQAHGAAGLSSDTPLAALYAQARALHIVDGPDEVHRMSIARQELRRYRDSLDAPTAKPETVNFRG